MTNNEILRRIRYLLHYNDLKMIAIFKLADYNATKREVTDWLRGEDDPSFLELTDKELAIFLNGLIIEKRGRREGPHPKPETELNNNLILWKLKIALNLKTDDIIEMFASIDKRISKPELSAFLRNRNHPSYRYFMDQYMRNFLNGLQANAKRFKK